MKTNGLIMDEDMVAELLCQEPPLTESNFHDEDMLPSHPHGAEFQEKRYDLLLPASSTSGVQLGHVCCSSQTSPNAPHGSPQAVVDETSLQKQRDKNKMSLKVKLMLRRPVSQLVDQGIMPPPKTPSAFFEQRRHLERARTGDILKTKIEKRPDRQALVQQHILEDTRIAPSLHESQRKLKRARLQDYLNDKLSHRPGPLELVQGNILKLSSYDNDSVVSPVIEGSISFKKASEADSARTTDTEPECEEEEGSSSADSPTGALWNLKDLQVTSPASVGTAASTPASLDASVKAPSPAPSIVSHSSCPSPQQSQLLESPPKRSNSLVQPDSSATSSQGYPGSLVANVVSSLSQSAPGPSTCIVSSSLHNNHRRSKKCRIKPPVPQKTRTIKFHEYKGPPVAQNKSSKSNSSSESASKQPAANLDSETPYDILLKQQQLFLQWQLEVQQKCSVDPKDQNSQSSQVKLDSVELSDSRTSSMTLTFPAHNQPAANTPPTIHVSTLPSRVLISGPPEPPPLPLASVEKVEEKPPRRPSKPDDLKVNDLKVELKKRNLTVSGSKPQLLERLKNFLSSNPDDKLSIADSPKSVGPAESPHDSKAENDQALSPISVSSENSSSNKIFGKTSSMPIPTQQLSFSQLDPVQQQQATTIALQALALQMPGSNATTVPQLQNTVKINAIPSVPMDVDSQQSTQNGPAPHQTIHTIPTIFVATSQPTGNALQAPCVPLSPNYVPYIITMNGLNSTLNLINGFNLGTVVTGDSQKPAEAEQTSTQKLQQHLQQKMLMQQMQREQKPSIGSNGNGKLQPAELTSRSSQIDASQLNNNNHSYYGYQSPSENDRMDTTNSCQGFDSSQQIRQGSAHTSCSNSNRINDNFTPSSFMDGIKSEAIDDVLEILIRNGELPPSAAEGVLPKNLILQHSKAACKSAGSAGNMSSMYDRRLSNHQVNFQNDHMSPSSNYCGPLPPISSISPANHGSPLSVPDNSEMNAMNQQLTFMEYLSQAASTDCTSGNTESHQPHQYCNMDYTSSEQPSSQFIENQSLDHSMSTIHNSVLSDDNSGIWLDEWLSGPFLDNLQEPLDQHLNNNGFSHENNMQTDASHSYHQGMDMENFLGQNSMDHMFDVIFNDISGSNGAPGFLSGTSLPASSVPMYWSDSDNML